MKPVRLRALADADFDAALDHGLDIGGAAAGHRLNDAVSEALSLLSRQPGIGSGRHAALTGITGLRCWPLSPLPYLIFYVERDSHIDVLRLLHQRQDIARQLGSPP